jgi:transposase InsO family protein
VGAVVDHFSRSVVASASLEKEPTTREVCAVLDAAVSKAGRPPRHIVSDQGAQFRGEYRAWCAHNGVLHRYGAVGEHGSIAIIERFWRTLKDECFRRILVPLAKPTFDEELAAYLHWYHAARPHQALRGATPAEVLAGCSKAGTDRRIETRERFPLPKTGPPTRRLEGELKLVVTYQSGREHLPVVELIDERKAA